MFTTQEETIKKIDEIQDNNERLNKPNKETQGHKLSLDASQEIFKKKFEKVNDHLAKQRAKPKEDINELWNDNYQLCKRLRDLALHKT